MGKVGSILLVAAGAALQFIPGVGNFVGSALMSAGLGVGAVTVITGALIAAGLATALSMASALFAPSLPRPEAADHQVRGPTPLRLYIYGIRRSYGALMLFETATSGSAVDVLAFMDGRAQSTVAVYLNDDRVTLSAGFVQQLADERYFGNNVRAGYTLGAATGATFSPVIAELPGIWTSNHRGDGIVAGYLIKAPVNSDDFLKVYPQGDNISLSLAISSWRLFDPRSGSDDWADENSWTGPNDNGVLALLHYLVMKRGEDYAARILPAISHWITAANLCDSARPLKSGATEKLYRCWLMYDSMAKPADVIAEMLKTFDGWMGEDENGNLIVYAGEVYPPTQSIGPEQIIDYELVSFVPDEDRVNEIIINYVSAAHDYNTVEASAWRDETDIIERGKVNSTTFSPQVPSHAQGQYLAKRYMAKANAPYSGTIRTTFAGRSIMGQRYINLTIEEAGAHLFDGTAEIINAERDPQTGGMIFQWVIASATTDQWIPAINEGDPAPVGARVPLSPLALPDITSAVPDFSDIGESTGEGGGTVTGVRIIITATGPDRPDITWYARWRVGAGAWSESIYPDSDPGSDALLTTNYVPYGATVDVQVGYSISDGRFSGWSATETVDTTP